MKDELRFDKFIDFLKKGKKEEKKEEKEIILYEEKIEEVKTYEKEKEYLFFEINKEFYALPLKNIKEIYKEIEIITSCELPFYIIGFTKFKKNMIPIVDISKILNLETPQKKNYVLLEIEGKPLFILIGDIKGIIHETKENTFEVPFNLDKEIFQKIIYEDDKLVGCINVNYFSKIKK
jgi:chemotaxis signal transduction protein